MIQQCVKYIVITVYFNTIILYYLQHLYNPYNVGDGFVCQCVCGYWFQYERIFIASYSEVLDRIGIILLNAQWTKMVEMNHHSIWRILSTIIGGLYYSTIIHQNLVDFFTGDFYREKVTL